MLPVSARICASNTLTVVPLTQLVESSLSLQKRAHCKVKWSVGKMFTASRFAPASCCSDILLQSGQRSSSISRSYLDVSLSFETIQLMKQSCSLLSFSVDLASQDSVNSVAMCDFNMLTMCRWNQINCMYMYTGHNDFIDRLIIISRYNYVLIMSDAQTSVDVLPWVTAPCIVLHSHPHIL